MSPFLSQGSLQESGAGRARPESVSWLLVVCLELVEESPLEPARIAYVRSCTEVNSYRRPCPLHRG